MPSIATDKLQGARKGLLELGLPALTGLVATLRELQQHHADAGDLARVCRVAADALARVDNAEALERHRRRVHEHLGLIVDYAALLARGDSAPLAPPLLSLPDAEEEAQYRATVAMFVGNALGTVAELEEEILATEAHENPAEAVGAIRRTVHTLKAEFGVLQMAEAQKLCHDAETAIDVCVQAQRPFPVDVMLEVADWLQQYLDLLAKDGSAQPPPTQAVAGRLAVLLAGGAATASAPTTAAGNGDAGPRVVLRVEGEFADSLTEFITEARSHLADAEGALLAFESGGADKEQINLTFRAFHTIKGVAGFLSLKPIVDLAHIAETVLDEARSDRLQLTQTEVDQLLASVDQLIQMLAALEGQPAPAQAAYDRLLEALRRTAKGKLRGVSAPAAAPPVAVAAVASPSLVPPAAAPAAAGAPPAAATAPAAEKVLPLPTKPPAAADDDHKAVKVERSVKVNTMRLDMLVDMVGELVIAQSMVLQDPAIAGIADQILARNIGQVGKITRDLQEAAMSLRMVTVKATFQKMARLVRDVASKSGKRVALTIQGEDTELDRTVVEQISDPLVHMIRNAIDHGIEPADKRRAAGKTEEGRLLLRAYHQGGSIVIEIADDGRGLDKQKILAKAIEKGIMPAGTRVEDLDDQEAFGLIFLPGFSTAEKVTDLSGRGVGMDVVRRNIEALRGKVEIESTVGAGSTFRLRLPLTLAIIDGMVLRVGRERYVLPTMAIEQSFLADPTAVHYLADRGECVRARGEILPVYRLRDAFAIADGATDLTKGILVVVEVDGQRACLFVDEILGQQQVVIKSLGMLGTRVAGVSGGAIMSDGRVALILDLGAVLDSAVNV